MTKLTVPTPFNVGAVNTYLFEDDMLMLLDPGPDSTEAYETLEDELRNLGYTVTDIDRILVTHPHIDHFGIAATIREESGADVYAHKDAVPVLDDPHGYFERERRFFMPYLKEMGMPKEYSEIVTKVPEPFTTLATPVTVDGTLGDGDVVDVGDPLEAVHTPGHAPGSITYYWAAGSALFTGDHLLSHITPNPLLQLPESGDINDRVHSLSVYLDSLDRLLTYNADIAYGGHRADIQDVEARIHETISHHHERKETIREMLSKDGESPYSLMKEIFPDIPTTEYFLAMSEIIGHLDLLEEEGIVTRRKCDGTVRYQLE